MVRLSEWFNPGRVISQLGALKFPVSIFKDEIRFPNWEMEQALRLYETRPQINSGIKQFCRFVIGDELTAKSEDEKSQEFLQKWIDQRPGIKQEIFNFTVMTVSCGNGYIEPTYTTSKNGVTFVDNIFNMPDPSRVYLNMDHRKTDDEHWLVEVPIEVKMFPFQGKEYKPKFWRVNYIRGSILFQRLIYAIPIHKTKLQHCKIGWSRDGLYGRGFLSSCIDDGEILLEILKNLAIISRTRALNTKLISIGTEVDRATIEDMNKLDFDLRNRKENEHIIINKPVSELNMSHQGKYDKMDSSLDFLRHDIASGLVPNFLTPWNAEVNRATAGEVKIPFQMELNSYKEDIIQFLNNLIIKSLRQTYPWLAEDLSFEFGFIDLTSTEEKMTYAQNMFRDNVLSMNEYREAAGYDRVEDGDIWGYQMPSLPLEQIRQTETGDVPGQQAPAQQSPVQQSSYKMPKAKVKGEKKSLGKRTLTEVPHKPTFEEKKVNGHLRLEEDLTPDEVYAELFSTAQSVGKLMKKMKIGTLINAKPSKGLLSKEDKKSVIDIINEALNKSLELNKTPAEFTQELKDKIQDYEQGKPKYDPYIIERIARTELSRIREAGKLLKWKEEGYNKVMHITHRTANTGKKDLELDRKVFEIEYILSDKAQKDGNRIPLHPNCLPPGMLVVTRDTQTPIEQVKQLDLVLTHKFNWRQVTEITKREFNGFLHRYKELWATPEHPVFIDGKFVAIETISTERKQYSGLVYNIEVAQDESYVANGVAVHNCKCAYVPYE